MTVGESVSEMRERDRGGKSRAVFFWWGAALTVISVLALFLMMLIEFASHPPGSGYEPTPVWTTIL